jgi:Tfp pilus assembly protein PilF
MRGFRPVLACLLLTMPLFGDPKLELRGNVTGARTGQFRVSLLGLQHSFEQTVLILPSEEFRFRTLEPGSYTLEIRRRGVGSLRRTVVVSPSLADKKGIVHVSIPYVPAQAALEGRGMLVSRAQLSVPDKAWNKYQEARQRLARHETDRAVESLHRAIEYAPDFTAAWNSLGVIAYQRQEFEKAEEFFREALRAEPASFEAQVNLGGVLMNLGRWQEALDSNLRAYEARPQDPLANGQLGLAYFQLGKMDQAEKFLLETQRIDPAHFMAPQLYLARIYAYRGDNGHALEELRDYVARYPDAPNTERLRRRLDELK